jgi:hypothetical protein
MFHLYLLFLKNQLNLRYQLYRLIDLILKCLLYLMSLKYLMYLIGLSYHHYLMNH